ncbi:MAG: alpha/beta fold hydrolase [Elusimicrobiaceae bacterium]|nr:alpha/beta fold hydrolase [Elusimicrobiaceae bacterium]
MKKLALILVVSLLTGCVHAQPKQKITLQGDHGKLSAILQIPKDKKTYPLVMIMHGFNGHKDMPLFPELEHQLNERGIATIRFDFNGQGESEGSFLDMTIPNEIEDARKVYEYVRQLPGVESVSAVGHSQGGVVASMLAGQLGADKIKSIALLAPAGELKDDTAKGDLFGTQYDPENIPEYITLHIGLKVGRAFLATTPHLPIYEVASQYTGPVLIVHSVDDELVPYVYGERFKQGYKNAHLETLHAFDHSFTQDVPAVINLVATFFSEQLL